MKIKTKLTSLIIAFVLLASLLVVGVFALKETSLSIGGDINFTANGANAEIKLVGGTITNGSLVGQTIGNASGNKFSDISIDNNTTSSDAESKFSSWSGLNLAFNEAGDDLSFQVSVKNTAQTGADNYLCLTALADKGTAKNATVSVKNNAGGITALLYPQETATFTVTFKVKDKGTNASLQGFAIDFDMEKKALAEFDKKSDLETSEYAFYDATETKPYTISIGAKDFNGATAEFTTTLNGDVVVPDYVADGSKIYAVTGLVHGAFGHGGAQITFDFDSLTLPNTLQTLGSFSIYTTKSISIEIPAGVTTINYNAFNGCTGLKSVTIQESITTIQSSAFANTGLNEIFLPYSVNSVAIDAFYDCDTLETIVVEEGNSVYDSRNNCNAVIETATNTLVQGCKGTIIPETVTTLGNCCFMGHSLTTLVIPVSVVTIKSGVFVEATVGVVNYRGNQEQWDAIDIGESNSALTSATINYNYTGA